MSSQTQTNRTTPSNVSSCTPHRYVILAVWIGFANGRTERQSIRQTDRQTDRQADHSSLLINLRLMNI